MNFIHPAQCAPAKNPNCTCALCSPRSHAVPDATYTYTLTQRALHTDRGQLPFEYNDHSFASQRPMPSCPFDTCDRQSTQASALYCLPILCVWSHHHQTSDLLKSDIHDTSLSQVNTKHHKTYQNWCNSMPLHTIQLSIVSRRTPAHDTYTRHA
jgi:hypothetical protein